MAAAVQTCFARCEKKYMLTRAQLRRAGRGGQRVRGAEKEV